MWPATRHGVACTEKICVAFSLFSSSLQPMLKHSCWALFQAKLTDNEGEETFFSPSITEAYYHSGKGISWCYVVRRA